MTAPNPPIYAVFSNRLYCVLAGAHRPVHLNLSKRAAQTAFKHEVALCKAAGHAYLSVYLIEPSHADRGLNMEGRAWAKWQAADTTASSDTTPFCACGRRVSECDGSRTGCRKP